MTLGDRIEELVVDRWFAEPPELVAAMATAPTIAVTRAFVLGWSGFSQRFPRWVGAIVANCPEFEVIAFEVENLFSEVVRDPAAGTNHYELLLRLGTAVGLSRAEVEAHRPGPAAGRAFAYWDDTARNAEWVVGFAAVNGLEILGDRAIPLRHGLGPATGLEVDPWTGLGLPDEALEFFRVGSEADQGHGRETVAILDRYTRARLEQPVLATLDRSIGLLRDLMAELWVLAQDDERRPTGESG